MYSVRMLPLILRACLLFVVGDNITGRSVEGWHPNTAPLLVLRTFSPPHHRHLLTKHSVRDKIDYMRIQRSHMQSSSTVVVTDNSGDAQESAVPDFIVSPVLRQVYPHLLEYQKIHGHVNIPLGSTAGRQCQTLRRLQLQQKLTDAETELLTTLQFRFTTLDDVYFQTPFDEMFSRLQEYERQNPGSNYQIPKKYPSDPELGAWVTGIRRLAPHLRNSNEEDDYMEGETISSTEGETSSSSSSSSRSIHPDHVEKLNAIGFSWTSDRKCGSKFMQFYRELQQRILEAEIEQQQRDNHEAKRMDDDETQRNVAAARQLVLQNPTVQTWIAAQREAYQRGTMSITRQHYMTSLVGDESWKMKTIDGKEEL